MTATPSSVAPADDDRRPPLDRWFARIFDDPEPTRLGSGWASGTTAVFLGLLGLGGVLCLHFPELLTWPRLREVYVLIWIRRLIGVVIGLAFLFGLISAVLRTRKVLGFTGMGLALGASLLGGAGVEIEGAVDGGIGLGFDWFLLNLLLLAVIFVPMERLWPLRPEQSTFRPGWTTDTMHFLVSHLLVQVSTLLTLAPATIFFTWATHPALQAWVRELPAVVQFLAVILVADLAEYTIHRLFHTVPVLWRFHAVHHSIEEVDWLAGSRLHLVDVVLTRGFTFLPIYLLGFEEGPVYAYLTFVSFHAVFIHANVRWKFGWLERLIVTPRFHHWHHSSERAAVNRNYAVHLPWIDRLFGTYYAPEGQWPRYYGLGDEHAPLTWGAQFVWPFRRRKASQGVSG
jgi:sterol desaturase/sphingolipid hydroxylase (fatty acid hydroxylase superfamily)